MQFHGSHQILLLLGLSFVLSFFNFGRKLLFPFQVFTTWAHECCHAMTAALLGGSAIRISIASDCSGVTQYKIPPGKLRQGIIVSSGYVGSALIGCAIFFLSIHAKKLNPLFTDELILYTLCGVIALSLIFWMRNLFGFISVLILASALFALIYFHQLIYMKPVLMFLGIQTGLNAVFDIRVLFKLGKASNGISSDAHAMQKLFYLPYWMWAWLWLGLSLMMMYWTLRLLGYA